MASTSADADDQRQKRGDASRKAKSRFVHG
jgi:hypothetical protein